jgi:hypothetical protein
MASVTLPPPSLRAAGRSYEWLADALVWLLALVLLAADFAAGWAALHRFLEGL